MKIKLHDGFLYVKEPLGRLRGPITYGLKFCEVCGKEIKDDEVYYRDVWYLSEGFQHSGRIYGHHDCLLMKNLRAKE